MSLLILYDDFKYNVKEGEIASDIEEDAEVDFGMISSCLTLTAQLSSGRKIAGHCVLVPMETQLKPSEIFKSFCRQLSREVLEPLNETISYIDLSGQLDFWSVEFLTKNELGETIIDYLSFRNCLLEKGVAIDDFTEIEVENFKGQDCYFSIKPDLTKMKTPTDLNFKRCNEDYVE